MRRGGHLGARGSIEVGAEAWRERNEREECEEIFFFNISRIVEEFGRSLCHWIMP